MADAIYHNLQKTVYENKVKRGFNITDVSKEILLMAEELGELCNAAILDRRDDIVDAIGDLMVYCLGLSEMFGWDADNIVNRSVMQPPFDSAQLTDYLPYASKELGMLAKTYKQSNKEPVKQINLQDDFKLHLGNLMGYCRTMFDLVGADELSELEKIITHNKTRTHAGHL